MKRTILLSLFYLLITLSSAQPLLVGHRGSQWGVENTAEALINGALKGYHYLECDIKVAADGTIVLSHDDNTSRLGGSLTISKSSLAQLQSETYTQTRGGVTYTGTICTLAEYLDICVQYNVLPLIELKWATGINSNDQSGIPALVQLIESKGFRNKCIILTSMKPCLEYLRTHYPDINLQLLAWKHSRHNLRWCKQWRINADIHHSGINRRIIKKHHKAGLKINTWTINNLSAYQKFTQIGCDFITTDTLPSPQPYQKKLSNPVRKFFYFEHHPLTIA